MGKQGYKIEDIEELRRAYSAEKETLIEKIIKTQLFKTRYEKATGKETLIHFSELSDRLDSVERQYGNLDKALKHVLMQNENDQLSTRIPSLLEGIKDYFSLLERYHSKISTPSTMCGRPGGGWNSIALQEKLNLAGEEGNSEAMMDAIQQKLGVNELTETEILALLFGENMDQVKPFDQWKKEEGNQGKGWQDYLNAFFKGDEDRYKIYLSVQKFTSKRIEEQYGKPLDQMTKDEMIKHLARMGFSYKAMEKYSDEQLKKMLKGAEEAKIVAAIMLYQKNRNADISSYYDASIYTTSGVKIWMFGKEENGTLNVDINNPMETIQISRSGNENVGLYQDNKKEILPQAEIGTKALEDNVKNATEAVKNAEHTLKEARKAVITAIIESAIDFAPGGNELITAIATFNLMDKKSALLDGTDSGLKAFNKAVGGRFNSTKEAREALSKGLSLIAKVNSANENVSVATKELKDVQKKLDQAKKWEEASKDGGNIITDSKENIIKK